MRVCFLTSSYPRFVGDTAGTFIARLAQSLQLVGTEVQVVAPGGDTCPTTEVLEGIPVDRFHYFVRGWEQVAYGFGGVPVNLKRRPVVLLQLPWFYFFFLLKSRTIASNCDVLHVHWAQNAVIGRLATRLLGKPFVVTLWGSDLQWMEENRFVRSLTLWFLAKAEGIVCLTTSAWKALHGFGIDARRLCVIPNGVDTDLFYPRDQKALRLTLGLRSEETVLLYVGSLIRRKGLSLLLEAMHLARSSLENCLLVVVGDGEERPALLRQIEALCLAKGVRMVGVQPPERIPLWMAASDLFILPSYYEGLPNVLLEAMASGLPVVATDIPGSRDAVEEGTTGLLVPPGDAQALAKALDQILRDDKLRKEMSQSARQSILQRQLTWRDCALKHLELYERISSSWGGYY